MTVTVRPLTTADAPRLTALLAQAEAREPADMHWHVDELVEILAEPGRNLAAESVGYEVDGRLVAAGLLEVSTPAETWQAMQLGVVADGHLRQGWGTRLVDDGLRQAAVLREAVDPALPGELRLWVPERRLGLLALAEHRGFGVRRYFRSMRRELTGLPRPPELPADLRHTVWTDDRDEAVRAASNAAFADHWGSRPMTRQRWRSAFADAGAFRPELSRLAVRGDDVASFVLVEEYVAETEERGYRTAHLARIGTVRDHRGAGLAAALVGHSLTAAADAGFRFADLEVDSDSPTGAGRLYTRLGFAPTTSSEVRGSRF